MHEIDISPTASSSIDLALPSSVPGVLGSAGLVAVRATAVYQIQVPTVTAVRSAAVAAPTATKSAVALVPVAAGDNAVFLAAITGQSSIVAKIPVVSVNATVTAVIATSTGFGRIPATTLPVSVDVNAVKASASNLSPIATIMGEAVLTGGGAGTSTYQVFAPTWAELPGTGPTTITSRVAASLDDVYYQGPTPSLISTANDEQAGCNIVGSANPVCSQMRFTGIAIPNGAVITSATITGRATASDTLTAVNTKLRGMAANNPSSVSTTTGSFQNPPFTTAVVNWDNIPPWNVGTDYVSPNISSIIQELVNRPGWVSGNAIVISWDDLDMRSTQVTGTYRRWMSYDFSPANAPLLTVTWT